MLAQSPEPEAHDKVRVIVLKVSNWNLEMVFTGEGKTRVPGETPFRARTRTNNKLN